MLEKKSNRTILYNGSCEGETRLENLESEKDLGVIIDTSLSFGENISSKISTANRNLGLIFRTFTFMDKVMLF